MLNSPAPGLRPWLSVEDGELVVEPVAGISFSPSTTREELSEHLTDLAAFGVCEVALQQDDSATFFTISTGGEATTVVFDDASDRIVAIVPLVSDRPRLWN